MSEGLLVRDDIDQQRIFGQLRIGDDIYETIERPWLPTEPGGMPFKSCVPAGRYRLRFHERSNGDIVLALINPGLGVYYRKTDRPNNVGRYKILIHSANWVDQIAGCIAPGIERATHSRGDMVTSSSYAMGQIMEFAPETLEIRWRDGEPWYT